MRVLNEDFVGVPGPPFLIFLDGVTEQSVTMAIHAARARGGRCRTLTMSPASCGAMLESIPPEEKQYKYDQATLHAVEDKISLQAPGVQCKVEVTFALPDGIISID